MYKRQERERERDRDRDRETEIEKQTSNLTIHRPAYDKRVSDGQAEMNRQKLSEGHRRRQTGMKFGTDTQRRRRQGEGGGRDRDGFRDRNGHGERENKGLVKKV